MLLLLNTNIQQLSVFISADICSGSGCVGTRLWRQQTTRHGPLTRYVKLQVAHAPGMPGKFSPPPISKVKPLVSDPGMHHGTCVTHVPWCMSGSLTCGDGENVPGIPRACAPAILRIWQEAHMVRAQVPWLKIVYQDPTCIWPKQWTGQLMCIKMAYHFMAWHLAVSPCPRHVNVIPSH